MVDGDIPWLLLVSKTLLFHQQPVKHEVHAKTTNVQVHKELEHEDYVCKEPNETQSQKARFTVTEVDGEYFPEEVRGFAQISCHSYKWAGQLYVTDHVTQHGVTVQCV